MKKRIIACVLVSALVLCGLQVYAAGGASDSLISISYLTNTFLPALEKTIETRASSGTQATYDAAKEKLDGLGAAYMAELGGSSSGTSETWTISQTAECKTVKRGDVITVAAGSSLLWSAGVAVATAGLVDATAGKEISADSKLSASHRYLNGLEQDSVTVTILSDTALVSLEGSWRLAESGEEVTAFTDLVQSTDWFYDAVRYAVTNGMFQGVTTSQFAPNATMDRSMLATVLYRMEGSPAVMYSGIFPDVAAGQWYTAGVEWASAQSIVFGLGDGTFAPATSVTREQIASMLYRYAKDFLKLDTAQSGDLSKYEDHLYVSDWAEEGMVWAVGAGIISGADGGMLLPGNNASRAEVATMLQRFEHWKAELN